MRCAFSHSERARRGRVSPSHAAPPPLFPAAAGVLPPGRHPPLLFLTWEHRALSSGSSGTSSSGYGTSSGLSSGPRHCTAPPGSPAPPPTPSEGDQRAPCRRQRTARPRALSQGNREGRAPGHVPITAGHTRPDPPPPRGGLRPTVRRGRGGGGLSTGISVSRSCDRTGPTGGGGWHKAFGGTRGGGFRGQSTSCGKLRVWPRNWPRNFPREIQGLL